MLQEITMPSMIRRMDPSSSCRQAIALRIARFAMLALAPATLALAAWLTGCSTEAPQTPSAEADVDTAGATQADASKAVSPKSPVPGKTPQDVPPVVVLHTSAGDIKVQLFADKAPQTVDNFLSTYASRGFYETTIFHHVEAGSMLIGGGYTADLEPKTVRTAIYNESRSSPKNRRGTVAMIRDPESPHSATSQFFINLADNPDLDFKVEGDEDMLGYCVFGEVIEGMEVVDRIAQMPTATQGDFAKVPSPPVAIQSVQRLR